jgi:glycerophosphoryl diester phosphodiesterase
VRILAHRGAPCGGAVENTVPAVTEAFAAADGVEVDLRLTADGVLAVCHDPALTRLTGRPLEVAATSWDALRRAACDSGVPLARAEWMLAAAAGRPVVLELKAPPPAPRAVERTVQVLLERLGGLHAAGLPLEVTVSSFSPTMVAAVRAAAPARLALRTALLSCPGRPAPDALHEALVAGHDELHPHVTDLFAAPQIVPIAAARGVAVVPWTVNARQGIRRCAELGVTGLITDRPTTARLALTFSRAA